MKLRWHTRRPLSYSRAIQESISLWGSFKTIKARIGPSILAGDDNRMAAELRKQLKKARQQRKLGGRKARAAARDL